MRLALVHEFRTRSKVLVCTEAGAKGLNLQFCETVINYDLPWNPQRIEQRIGRCHRYGQEHDVTVVNFISTDNDADRLTFEILARKLDLFGRVLYSSDHVLHVFVQPALNETRGAAPSVLDGATARVHIVPQPLELADDLLLGACLLMDPLQLTLDGEAKRTGNRFGCVRGRLV